MSIHANQKVSIATEGLLKVTGSLVPFKCDDISKTVQDSNVVTTHH